MGFLDCLLQVRCTQVRRLELVAHPTKWIALGYFGDRNPTFDQLPHRDGGYSMTEHSKSMTSKDASPIIEVYKAIRAHEIMLNEATSRFEHAVVAPLLLLNGGGAVAYLTLLGALGRDQHPMLSARSLWIVPTLGLWALGLILAQLAVTMGLRAQQGYSISQRQKRHDLEMHLIRDDPEAVEILKADPQRSKRKGGRLRENPRLAGHLFDLARWASLVMFFGGTLCAAYSIY
jgi:hypothetical protein